MGTSIAPPSNSKHKFSTNSPPYGPWYHPWKTTMDSTPPNPFQIPCDPGRIVRLTCICDNSVCVASYKSSHITCMVVATHNSIQTHQANFDTSGISISIDNFCSVTILHSRQDFVGPLKKGLRIINKSEGPKVHIIYEVTISLTINYYSGHPRRAEIPNSLYGWHAGTERAENIHIIITSEQEAVNLIPT